MNKYEIALKNSRHFGGYDGHYLLNKLVKRATAKKIKRSIDKRTVNEGISTRNDKCPDCNSFIPHKTVMYRDTKKGMTKYCWNCGQALDWSE